MPLGKKTEKELMAWEMAEKNGNPYIFKLTATSVETERRGDELVSVEYLLTLYKVVDKSVIFQCKTTRLGKIFGIGSMQNPEKTIIPLSELLAKMNIISY